MEKRTSSSRSASSKASNAKEAALGAAYVCLALALSFLESQIPFDALVPIPGFKLGLANIVICTVFYRHSAKTALLVLICRLALSFILARRSAFVLHFPFYFKIYSEKQDKLYRSVGYIGGLSQYGSACRGAFGNGKSLGAVLYAVPCFGGCDLRRSHRGNSLLSSEKCFL